jgi:RNA polymerase sigma-70 factor (ECF subfamily)
MGLTKIDQNLLKRCFDREPGAWRDFVDRFIGLLIHAIQHTAQSRSVILSQDDVDDLCGEIFLAILQDDYAILKRFRGDSSLATYLAVISRRVAVQEITNRRKAEEMGHVHTYGAGTNALAGKMSANAGPTETEQLINRETVQVLIDGLPTKEATIIKMYHLEGKTYQEISDSLKIPVNSIGPTLTRARDMLKSKPANTATPT